MFPVLLGSTALIAAALWPSSSSEQYGAAQWGPPKPTNVGYGLMTAVKDLGNAIAKYPRLMSVMGPVLTQMEMHHNEVGEPGYLRGFAIQLTDPAPPPNTPLLQWPTSHQNLELLEAIAVLVGLRNGLQPAFGVIRQPGIPDTFVVGFTTTPNVFWTGPIAMLPSPAKARQLTQILGGRRPGFDPAFTARQTMVAARNVRMPRFKKPRIGRVRFPSAKRHS